MEVTRVLTQGHTQSVQLPKGFQFDTDEVVIARIDGMVVLFPRSEGWNLMKRGIERFTDDYMADRDQPDHPEGRIEL